MTMSPIPHLGFGKLVDIIIVKIKKLYITLRLANNFYKHMILPLCTNYY